MRDSFSTQVYFCILDEPEIDVEAEKVHSGLGKEAHLTCIVHGEPRPMVSIWSAVHSPLRPQTPLTLHMYLDV